MKNNKTTKRDESFKTALYALGYIWDNVTLTDEQSLTLYGAMTDIQALAIELGWTHGSNIHSN